MLNAEITNNCVCVVYDEETGMTKQDEYGDVRSDECFGCFDESIDDLNTNLLPDWLSERGASHDNYVVIDGSGMGWQRRSGTIIARATGKAIVKALSINGDFILRFAIKDGALTAVRSSHDELGASFSIGYLRDWELERARDEFDITVVEE